MKEQVIAYETVLAPPSAWLVVTWAVCRLSVSYFLVNSCGLAAARAVYPVATAGDREPKGGYAAAGKSSHDGPSQYSAGY
jgi:hypothetical protein